MSLALVTGSAGLIGSEAVRYLFARGFEVAGIDNDLRGYFFGAASSTRPVTAHLQQQFPAFRHHACDIRDEAGLRAIFAHYGRALSLIIHTAGQPSHSWAAREPLTDFGINATGTLHLLEATRHHCPEAVFIFTSTNKVYGDHPNRLPLVEQETRWELDPSHPYATHGVDESMSIDKATHSLLGASKLAADIMTQEYARYFGIKTGVFRGGCLTGPQHAGAELHGFLAYLMKCARTGTPYHIQGYQGKQVRDNIHCRDLVEALFHFYTHPRPGEVYNIGGSRFSHCSLREAVRLCEEITGRPMATTYTDTPRTGDHQWWISDVRKFAGHYPGWQLRHTVRDILVEMYHYQNELPG